jgi:polyhydroxybutyrate depolymerase
LVASFSYPPANPRGDCDKKPGAAGATNGLSSRDGFHYNVRAPANLDPTYAHPLLVVYEPAGHSEEQSEYVTRLTTDATHRGFIVTYVGSRSLSLPTIIGLARIPKEVASSWCVDPNRVYATGHSDGGTVSTALALLKETRGTVSAIAPSAAGLSQKDLERFQCPEPIPVMVMHGKSDTHFPGWGTEAALWWARCNACDVENPPVPQDDGCFTFAGCAPGGRTVYCEGAGTHMDWPPVRNRIIQFLESAGSP